MVAALYLSVVPSYAAKLLDTGNLALLGAIAASLLAASCAAQLLAARRDGTWPACNRWAWRSSLPGSRASSSPSRCTRWRALFASAVLGGAGHGLAFLGAQAEINELAPIERRGEVTAAFISCIYFGVAMSAIGVGLLSTALSLRAAVTIFAIASAHRADRDRLAPGRADQGAAGGSLSSASSRESSAWRARTSPARTLALSFGGPADLGRQGRALAREALRRVRQS